MKNAISRSGHFERKSRGLNLLAEGSFNPPAIFPFLIIIGKSVFHPFSSFYRVSGYPVFKDFSRDSLENLRMFEEIFLLIEMMLKENLQFKVEIGSIL